jgi:hypothetical protein
MNIIVFSKDRAMQLELFLRSFNKYVTNYVNYKINILYTFSNENFKLGYDKLMKKYNYLSSESNLSVNWVKETDFKSNLISLIDMNNNYIVFFVDDIVFKNPIDFYDEQMTIFENDPDILCRSLRLQPNFKYSYASKEIMTNPEFLEHNIYNWKDESGDYGYPMSVDGHIYRTKDIIPYILKLPYKNPNSFEGQMAIYPMLKPKMIIYDKSIIINNPCNKVQTNNPNFHGNISAEFLNNKYLDGYIISLENFDGIETETCHQEINLIFKK